MVQSINGRFQKTHGQSKTRLYGTWMDMKSRCLYVAGKYYSYYGGRGITICDEWLDFEAFMRWARSSGYEDNLTIDRIDGNKGYEPSNCRWATRKQQQRNLSTNRKVIRSDGMEFGSVGEAAEVTGTFPQSVFRILRGDRKTTRGYSFAYVE